MYNYTIIIEKTDTGYSAYVPDLPGCITVGDTINETKRHIKEAVELYIEQLKVDGKPIPEPSTISEIISV
jgi:predicted RNase H-like HicB family nuclease